jgi:hypothetical protein
MLISLRDVEDANSRQKTGKVSITAVHQFPAVHEFTVGKAAAPACVFYTYPVYSWQEFHVRGMEGMGGADSGFYRYTPRIQANTPHIQANTPHIQANTPRVQANTPHIQADTPRVQANTPRIQANIQPEGCNLDEGKQPGTTS